jgi:hypothetical protein
MKKLYIDKKNSAQYNPPFFRVCPKTPKRIDFYLSFLNLLSIIPPIQTNPNGRAVQTQNVLIFMYQFKKT